MAIDTACFLTGLMISVPVSADEYHVSTIESSIENSQQKTLQHQ